MVKAERRHNPPSAFDFGEFAVQEAQGLTGRCRALNGQHKQSVAQKAHTGNHIMVLELGC